MAAASQLRQRRRPLHRSSGGRRPLHCSSGGVGDRCIAAPAVDDRCTVASAASATAASQLRRSTTAALQLRRRRRPLHRSSGGVCNSCIAVIRLASQLRHRQGRCCRAGHAWSGQWACERLRCPQSDGCQGDG
ncbi:hypothetical protein VPH35_040545 [Triticum aestivum]